MRLSRFTEWLGIDYSCGAAGQVTGRVTLKAEHEGPPGHVHGGILTTLLDEAMGTAAWCAGHRVVAANLNVDFRRPVPLGIEVQVVGSVESSEGRKVRTSGGIYLPDGTLAVESKGLFVENPVLFDESGYRLR
jgi:uncharacterized protein (TIGR00369 family)